MRAVITDIMAFLSFEDSVRDDLKFLRDSPFLRKELAGSVRGFVLDITTGLLKPVA